MHTRVVHKYSCACVIGCKWGRAGRNVFRLTGSVLLAYQSEGVAPGDWQICPSFPSYGPLGRRQRKGGGAWMHKSKVDKVLKKSLREGEGRKRLSNRRNMESLCLLSSLHGFFIVEGWEDALQMEYHPWDMIDRVVDQLRVNLASHLQSLRRAVEAETDLLVKHIKHCCPSSPLIFNHFILSSNVLQTSAFLTGAPKKYGESNAHNSAADQIVLLRRRVRLETARDWWLSRGWQRGQRFRAHTDIYAVTRFSSESELCAFLCFCGNAGQENSN